MISALDLFTIGIGPSSSHTVGPMRAAARFARSLEELPVARVRCDFHGSLAATGKGHGTDGATLLGLMGETPEGVDVDAVPEMLGTVRETRRLRLAGGREVPFDERKDLSFKRLKPLPRHPNGMHFVALGANGEILGEEVFYSLGGGFVATEAEMQAGQVPGRKVIHTFASAAELLENCRKASLSISELILANEAAFRPEAETRGRLDRIWETMQACVKRGCSVSGTLPGGLAVPRRAQTIYEKLRNKQESALSDPLSVLDWVNLYALARCTRVTRGVMPVSISQAMVPAFCASSSTRRWGPKSSTSSPTARPASVASTMIWSIVTRPITGRRLPPTTTSVPLSESERG